MVVVADGYSFIVDWCIDCLEQWFRHGSVYLYAFLGMLFHLQYTLQI